jgi:hypothetical protein
MREGAPFSSTLLEPSPPFSPERLAIGGERERRTAGEEQECRAVAPRAGRAARWARPCFSALRWDHRWPPPPPFSPAEAVPSVERVGSKCGGKRGAGKEGSVLWKDDEEGMAGSSKRETSGQNNCLAGGF